MIDDPHTGVSGNALNIAHNVTITFTCTTNGRRTPDWFVNGTVVLTSGDRYRSSTRNGIHNKTATLTINGSCIHSTLNIYCEVYNMIKHQFLQMHMTTLTIQGECPCGLQSIAHTSPSYSITSMQEHMKHCSRQVHLIDLTIHGKHPRYHSVFIACSIQHSLQISKCDLPQAIFLHLKVFTSTNTSTPQPLNGTLLTLQ